MEWRGRRQSGNIEDRTGQGGGGGGGRGLGIGSVGLLGIVVVGWFFGIDLTPLLNGGGAGQNVQRQADPAASEFAAVTLGDTEDVWAKVFKEQVGKPYQPVTLVLYAGVTNSPCGDASGATGPFYCPGDQKVYLDTDFFNTLSQDLGAKGDFANAYVVAHEVGHHVQDLLGILGKANQQRAQVSDAESNAISVRIELQADCFAGLWGRDAKAQFGSIEAGDFEEAINAAKKIGDDTLQRNAGRQPMPDSFTHGTSAQRSKWFQTGLNSGQISACDTFSAQNP
jgi:predicted metalloprotease